MTLRRMIIETLSEYPSSRDSDIILTQLIWCKYYKDKIKFLDKEAYFNIKDLFDLPNQESIKRIRAIIQNTENRYLPMSEKVRKERRIKEQQVRMELGYHH